MNNNNYGNYPQYNVNYYAGNPDQQKESSRKAIRVAGIIFSVIFIFTGLILFGVSVFISIVFEKVEEQCSEKTTAVVTDNVKNTNNDGDTTFAPVYTFTVDGEIYNVQSEFSSSPAVYEIGDEAEIRYDPSNPKNIYDPKSVKVFKTVMKVFHYLGIAMAVFGFVLVVVDIILTRKPKREGGYDELNDYYNK